MGEKPILFSGPMVRAILSGRKTVTRRVVKPQPTRSLPHTSGLPGGDGSWSIHHPMGWRWNPRRRDGWTAFAADGHLDGFLSAHPPYGLAGDRLWVRETFFVNDMSCVGGPLPKNRPAPNDPTDPDGKHLILYRADGEFSDHFEQADGEAPWRPSIHMPRWASRLTLEVTDVRAERLQEITEEDAKAEGAEVTNGHAELGALTTGRPSHREGFAQLWREINGKRPGCSWEQNPWIWRVEFRVVPAGEGRAG